MTAVIAAVVVAGIYFGRPVLMPLALAVLLSFALAPLVALLSGIGWAMSRRCCSACCWRWW